MNPACRTDWHISFHCHPELVSGSWFDFRSSVMLHIKTLSILLTALLYLSCQPVKEIRLRTFPYPYKAAFTIADDIDRQIANVSWSLKSNFPILKVSVRTDQNSLMK
jgi:hypothetical protein